MAKLQHGGSGVSPYLFPILPSSPGPTGIARMAKEAERTDDGHLIEFKAIKVRSILNRSVSKRGLSLAYSINPYRGCEFGCRYCYARYTHEFLRPEPVSEGGAREEGPVQAWATAFEREIYLKQGAAWLLEQELRRVDPAEEIALGTATDPYQPIERRARIMRSLLEVFARKSGYRLGIVTKSRLIERDIDLLLEIAARNTLVVHVTITTDDPELARLLEPRAPRPDLRLRAVDRLRGAGITTGVLCSPLLPGITDTAEAIDRMAGRVKEVRGSFFAAQPLFLKSCSRPTYLSFVREHFPALESLYKERFAKADFADGPYKARMAEMVREACRRHGLNERSTDALLTRDAGLAKPVRREGEPVQARLFA
jgi:DNA repair photolyase